MWRRLSGQVKLDSFIVAVVRTQDPHHPFVCGARLVIAHPEQKQHLERLNVQVIYAQ